MSLLRRPLPRTDVRQRTMGDGFPLWILFAQVQVGLFVFLDFGTFRQVNPKPHFALVMMNLAVVVLLAPRGLMGRVRVSAPVAALIAWWLLSYAWSPSSWKNDFTPMLQLAAVSGLTIVASVLPLERLRTAWLRSFYLMTAYVYLYTLAYPSTSTVLLDPYTGALVNAGWHGPFNHKNNLAAFMVVGVVSVLGLERHPTRRRIAVAAMLMLVLLTRSGTGAGGLLTTLGIYSLSNRYSAQSARKGGVLVAIATFGGLIMAAVGALFLPSILGLYGKDLTLTSRTDIWASVWPAIKARPWTGYGWGGVWTDPSVEPTASILRRLGFSVFHAHNGALEMVLELGIIGLALWFWVLFATVDGGRRLLRVNPAVARVVLAYCAFVTVSSFTEVLTVGPWLSMLVFGRMLTIRMLADARSDARDAVAPVMGSPERRSRHLPVAVGEAPPAST